MASEKDIAKAGIVSLVWLISFTVGAVKGDEIGFQIIGASSAVFTTIIYLSFLREHYIEEQREQRRRAAIRENFLREMAEIELERGERYDIR